VSRRKGCPLTGQTRRAILAYVAQRDGAHCHYCRVPFPPDTLDSATLDHYVPWSVWRMSRPRNLVLACGPCNERKADALPLTLAWLLLALDGASSPVVARPDAFQTAV
jgi:5-methylcytosine-specific restriction endonuclease McrA